MNELEQAKFGWSLVKDSFQKANSFIASMKSRVADGQISNELLKQRQKSCFGDENTPKCSVLQEKINGKFCGACGCKENFLARLDGDGYTKLHYPYLECPLKKPGFSNSSV